MTVAKSNGQTQEFEVEVGGRKLVFQTGVLAKQATSSVVARYGDTVVLATVVIGKNPREGTDFFPLMVEYEERFYAAGKIKHSRFVKREGKPSDEAVLSARLIDRAIRPLFPQAIRNDLQVILTVLSIDQENDPDIVSLAAASAALYISGLPWDGPIAGIRIGRINNEWVINPSYEARNKSELDLVVAGTPDKVLMIEAGADEVNEETMLEAIQFGQKHLAGTIKLIEEMRGKLGVKEITVEEILNKTKGEGAEGSDGSEATEEDVVEKAKKWLDQKIEERLFNDVKASKIERKNALEKLQAELEDYLKAEQIGKDKREEALDIFNEYIEEKVSEAILTQGKRVDGRKLDEVRELNIEVGLLPRTHGSALFNRGDTQVLSVVTLGGPSDEQILEGMEESGKKRFMHHYNFPPYSVGEVKPMRFPSRREIGHGALAERALLPMMPNKEEFPYTIRVVSEVLASNGSSSQASTCGASLALMDAGVPIKKAVAGVAMGLATDDKGNFKIITDLQDLEDGPGGMDFKVAGTRDGITSIQLDTKTHGLTREIVEQTLKQALAGRLDILEAMDKVIALPRPELSPYAPRIVSFYIDTDKIRDVIGPGGKMINEIIDATGVDIDIEDDGLVMVTSVSEEGSAKAVEWIKNLTRVPKPGELFKGKVTRIMDFGAFVEILPKQEGLVHISELAPYRVEKVTDVVQEGQEITVKVIEIDERGRLNLSLKQALGDEASKPPRKTERPTRKPRSFGFDNKRGPRRDQGRGF